jgi:rhomboid protease GluP
MILGARTPVTLLLLAAIGLMFLWETQAGGSTNVRVLVALGANHPDLVLQEGQWWRLVASMFLHIGVFHLLLNGWALFQLGALYEVWVGSARMLSVYFASGIAGSLASVFFTGELSAGASGAIFGILGGLIAFLARRHEHLTSRAKGLLGQLLLWAGINVVIGFTSPGIDNAAHLGGCAMGFALGWFVRERPLEA